MIPVSLERDLIAREQKESYIMERIDGKLAKLALMCAASTIFYQPSTALLVHLRARVLGHHTHEANVVPRGVADHIAFQRAAEARARRVAAAPTKQELVAAIAEREGVEDIRAFKAIC